jgi:hypothetical protein
MEDDIQAATATAKIVIAKKGGAQIVTPLARHSQ